LDLDAIVKPFSLLSRVLALSLSLVFVLPFCLSQSHTFSMTNDNIAVTDLTSGSHLLLLTLHSFLSFSQSSFCFPLCAALNEENRADLVNALKVCQSLKYEFLLFFFLLFLSCKKLKNDWILLCVLLESKFFGFVSVFG